MDWSPGQQAALDAVMAWIDAGTEPIFHLFGYAGTGKTTLAQEFATMVDGRVGYAAYTGKAALVLRQKGCLGAGTIHQLIYVPQGVSLVRLKELEKRLGDARGGTDDVLVAELEAKVRAERENVRRPSFTLNLDSEIQKLKCLIVDEVSMVGTQIGTDLRSFDVPILALGDPAQLPPVKDGGYFTNVTPEIMLDEVHRQAEGSPIIRMATIVRKGGELDLGDYGDDCRVILRHELEDFQEVAKFDQVLVGRNATRNAFNTRYRTEILGREGHLPVEGDRLVCLRNNHEKGLLNGSLWYVQWCETVDEDTIALVVKDSYSGAEVETVAHRHYFEGREKELGPWSFDSGDSFDYGYALTVHKAQGSQWDKVLLVDEGACFRGHAKRWRYTGITRAAKQLTVMRV